MMLSCQNFFHEDPGFSLLAENLDMKISSVSFSSHVAMVNNVLKSTHLLVQ